MTIDRDNERDMLFRDPKTKGIKDTLINDRNGKGAVKWHVATMADYHSFFHFLLSSSQRQLLLSRYS